ncbi:hypothetical protein [Chamaesiphon sp. VAR_48_metabat_403]|uniref:hypothetical protein n=1 Tax=Chamaesiphon sp. VAR_48_metabat_403 TaxID=2964700 RepID=UPI00286DF02F|nr:hypothetical protein [Chamaesiphon sp. VAR_48_metabat_403]
MNHHPSDDSANVSSGDRSVVAGSSVREQPIHNTGEMPDPVDTAPVYESHAAYQLDPTLQTALNCLDIKLEDELNRFRSQHDRDIGVTDVESMPQPSLQPEADRTNEFDADADILTAEIMPPAIEQPPEIKAPGGFIIIDGLTTTSSSSQSAIDNINYAPIALHRSANQAGEMELNFASGGEIAPFRHDEYSSSSQELLRQIQFGYPAADAASNQKSAPAKTGKKLFTPLKIGSLAAACVIAGGGAYAYFNPSVLAPLVGAKVASPVASTIGQSIQSPNLAANEFSELNLSALNTVKLPSTTAPTTIVSTAPTTIMGATSTAPAAIPFNVNGKAQIVPPTAITAQPRLADSLVRSLLPSNFHTFVKPTGYRAVPPRVSQ